MLLPAALALFINKFLFTLLLYEKGHINCPFYIIVILFLFHTTDLYNEPILSTTKGSVRTG